LKSSHRTGRWAFSKNRCDSPFNKDMSNNTTFSARSVSMNRTFKQFLFSNLQEEEKEFLRKRRSRERRLINIEREELARRQEEVKYRGQTKIFVFAFSRQSW
jgi:hypothetical protein